MTIINWPGGEHEFALRLGELEALQKATNGGPGAVLKRLHDSMAQGGLTGEWMVADIIDTLRLGLIGGGMDGLKARDLVFQTVERHGLPQLIPTAVDILLATFVREDDEPEKPEGVSPPLTNGTSSKS